jgi:hypothetical protein
MTLHAGYAATRISSNLNGSTKQFGWLQAPATIVASISITHLRTLQPSEFVIFIVIGRS